MIARFPTHVTFSTSDPALPLPSRDYLAIHAACARIAHMSGAAEYIQKVLRDVEEIKVLAEDGGSTRLLEEAFHVNRLGMVHG